MKEYVLIVGGAGYIGSHVTKSLAKAGVPTLVFDNLSYGHREFVRWSDDLLLADLLDREALRLVFLRYRIRAVMHFAGFINVGESVTDPEKYYRNNIIGTLNLLEAMREAGTWVIVFSSTCATYGEPLEVPIPETHPQNPINSYGVSKLVVEKALADYGSAYGLAWCALRYFNAAGADPDAEIGEWHIPETHLIPLILDAALGRRPDIAVFGTDYPTKDGTCIRDYIHVNDLAQAHVLALSYLDAGGVPRAFNLGNGCGHSVLEVIEAAKKVSGREIAVKYGGRRAGDPPALVGTADLARSVLGWKPKHSDIMDILATAWNWHRKQFSG
ncbi:MAG: UDP-glucose 4-epimerase GalE [Spirochaetota bacterium]|jgi:UDP-glucose 4-epimerase|nr:UDP-glucose 4-epimerase GalE [Spirochaetota bacterium]